LVCLLEVVPNAAVVIMALDSTLDAVVANLVVVFVEILEELESTVKLVVPNAVFVFVAKMELDSTLDVVVLDSAVFEPVEVVFTFEVKFSITDVEAVERDSVVVVSNVESVNLLEIIVPNLVVESVELVVSSTVAEAEK